MACRVAIYNSVWVGALGRGASCGSVGLRGPCSFSMCGVAVRVAPFAHGGGISVHAGRGHHPPLSHETLQFALPTWPPAVSLILMGEEKGKEVESFVLEKGTR